MPDLSAPALPLDDSGGRGDQAVVAGYPGGGPFQLGAARIRDTLNATGADIYHRSQTTREVFSLYADVEPGNSGGPLLSLKGDVYGVIFAKSLDDPQTGYALTVDEARPVVKAGRTATVRSTPTPAPDPLRLRCCVPCGVDHVKHAGGRDNTCARVARRPPA